MDDKVREAFFKQVEREPFARKFGFKLLDIKPGYSKLEMNITPDMENLWGMAHGSAIFALADEAFEIASNSYGKVALGLTVSITYISPLSRGRKLIAEAKEISQTDEKAVYEIKVFDDEHQPVAFCQALAYRTRKQLSFLKDH